MLEGRTITNHLIYDLSLYQYYSSDLHCLFRLFELLMISASWQIEVDDSIFTLLASAEGKYIFLIYEIHFISGN